MLLKFKEKEKEEEQIKKERKPLNKSQDTERKNLSKSQATERKNPPGLDDVTSKVPNMRNVPSTRYVHQATEPCKVDNSDRMRNVPSTRYVPGDTEPCKVDMIERAETFLNTATKNREPKQQYVSRNHCLPHNSTFCLLCRAYTPRVHYCVALNRYVNVDERQMLLIEGDTEAEVVGMENNTGKATLFENRRIMKFVLFNRVGLETEYKKHSPYKQPGEGIRNDHGVWTKQNEECVKSIIDQDTNNYIDNTMFERMKDWIGYFGFKANHIEMTRHQIHLKWQKLMLAEANRMSEETGIKIEECLANRFAEETGDSFEDCLEIANKMAESNLPIYKNVAHGDLMMF